ncbi:hypothetical protein BH24GEM2_BH24GEM2_12720 [soil metagenome]
MRASTSVSRVNHYCVEGCTVATQWTGVPVSKVPGLAGVLPDAQYVDFVSFDSGYHDYKSTKYLTRVVFLPTQTGGYWSDQGYEWYA